MVHASDNVAMDDFDLDFGLSEEFPLSGTSSNTPCFGRSRFWSRITVLINTALGFDLPSSSYSGPIPCDNASLYAGPPDTSTNTITDIPLGNSPIYNNGSFDSNVWYNADSLITNAAGETFQEPNKYQ
jgi:hypothetical protein